MQSNLLKRPPILTQLIVIFGLGLFLGIISIWLPPYFVIVGIAGIIYLVVAWLWPEIALLGILLFTSTIFDIYSLPSIPIGVGNLIVSDILIIVLIGIIFYRGMVRHISYFIHTPLDMPLLAFYGTAILATAVAIFNSRLTFNRSLGEIRIINYYLIFFIVTNLLRNEKQLRRLYSGIVFLAMFVALAMIVQYSLGNAVKILPGRVDTLSTASVTSYGITRVLPPGQSLILFAFVSLAVQLLFDKTQSRSLIYLIQLGIIGLAVLVTFNRSFWAAIALALLIVGLLISIREQVKYTKIVFWTVIVVTFIFTPLLVVKGGQVEKLMNAIVIRMSTLFNPDTSKEDSLVYRYIENEYAYPQIASHPLIGLGLGANYRPLDRRLDFGPAAGSLTFYVHNGHLWVILKTGLMGYLFFMWFLLLFIKRGLQNWKGIHDVFLKGLVLSFVAMVIGILAAVTVNPIVNQSNWAPIIAVMLGMSEVILRLNTKQSTDSQIFEELN